jgi:hypothetical protein
MDDDAYPRVSILHPDFSWHTTPTVAELQKRLSIAPLKPPIRAVAPFWLQRIVGFIHHRVLRTLSTWYCRWNGMPVMGQIWPLPFGLLMKWSDGTRIEEVITTRAVYDVGIPAPLIISYGAHPGHPHAPLSILMTRLPGTTLFPALWELFPAEERETTAQQLKDILGYIRSWGRHPYSSSAPICSIIGTSIRSIRVPFKTMPPCSDQAEFNRRLLERADTSIDDYENRRARILELDSLTHPIVFTHGDLAMHNILVLYDGRISGLIDWEAAGYYPEYWEYTTAYGLVQKGWWFDLVLDVAGGRFTKEHEGDVERWMITNGTML